MALDRPLDPDPEAPTDRPTGRRPLTMTVRPGRPIAGIGRRYSRFVGVMKVVLPLAALALIAMIAVWPALREQEQPMVQALEKEPDLLQVTAPVLIGTDDDDRPYSIAAARANQGAEGPHIVELSRPQGEIATRDGDRIRLQAEIGRFDRDSKQLHLTGDVRLANDDGYRFATEEAFVDMDTQSAWGDRPVLGQGPMGEIRSEGFRIENNGATVIFTGQAHAVLSGAAEAPPEAPPEAPQSTEDAGPIGSAGDEN